MTADKCKGNKVHKPPGENKRCTLKFRKDRNRHAMDDGDVRGRRGGNKYSVLCGSSRKTPLHQKTWFHFYLYRNLLPKKFLSFCSSRNTPKN